MRPPRFVRIVRVHLRGPQGSKQKTLNKIFGTSRVSMRLFKRVVLAPSIRGVHRGSRKLTYASTWILAAPFGPFRLSKKIIQQSNACMGPPWVRAVRSGLPCVPRGHKKYKTYIVRPLCSCDSLRSARSIPIVARGHNNKNFIN